LAVPQSIDARQIVAVDGVGILAEDAFGSGNEAHDGLPVGLI